jgi:hypothetical protein
MRTGFPQADARDDFDRARRQARWVKLAGWVRGRPSSRNRLLVLGEVTIVTGASRHGLASEAAVPIDHIVGISRADAVLRPPFPAHLAAAANAL